MTDKDSAIEPIPSPSESVQNAVGAVFGDRADLARRFVQHLATTGVERGLIGPREVPRLWERHVLNCAVLHELIPEDSTVADVGSGAGLPGIALAIARPDLRITLIEPMERRTVWAQEVISDLGLDVDVIRARAEEVHGHREFDVVTARAVAALDKLAKWTLPLTKDGGRLLALKGASAEDEIRKASKTLRRLSGTDAEVCAAGGALLEIPTTVVRVVISRAEPQTKGLV